MSIISKTSRLRLVVCAIVVIAGCKPRSCQGPYFDGHVVGAQGEALGEVTVEVAAASVLTDERGYFRLCVEPSDRYSLNVTKIGFRFVSRIYADTATDLVIQLDKATVVTIPAGEPEIFVRDVNRSSTSPLSQNSAGITSPLDTIPFVYDPKGRLVGFEYPKEIRQTNEATENFRPPRLGATVSVSRGALVVREGDKETSVEGPIDVSLGTVDIYGPDGMPGDYTMRFPDGTRGFMRTYGAADVNFYSGKSSLQLRKGAHAILAIPVDTMAILVRENLPDSIPLLVYEKGTGEWVRDEGRFGYLNAARDAYEAKITHFSVFNMDMEFSNPACYKMCNLDIPTNARVEIAVPGKVKSNLTFGPTAPCTNTGTAVGCDAGEEAYMVSNLNRDQPVVVRFFTSLGVIQSNYVFEAGGGASPHDTDCSNNYSACSGPSDISFGVTAPYMNADGTMNKPVIAVEWDGVTSKWKVSWLYVQNLMGNPATNYRIEWSTNFGAGIDAGNCHLMSGNTEWHDSAIITLPSDGQLYKFRIHVGVNPADACDAAPACTAASCSDESAECYDDSGSSGPC